MFEKIAVRTNLIDRNLLNGGVLDCPLCGRVKELIFHLLFSCDFFGEFGQNDVGFGAFNWFFWEGPGRFLNNGKVNYF